MTPFLIRALDKLLVAPLAWVLARLRGHPATPPAPGRVVAMKLVGMGDAVLMLPALAAIRQRGCHLTVITSVRCAAIFAAPDVADAVVIFDPLRPWHAARTLWQALRQTDLVMDFEHHVYWSSALAAMARPAAWRLGFRARARHRNPIYDQLVEPGLAPRPMKEIFDELARAAGFEPVAELVPLPITAAAAAAAESWQADHGLAPRRFVVLAPGSGATVSFRRLPLATWLEIADGLPDDWDIVLAGGPGDRPLLAAIAAGSRRPVATALGLPLQQLAAVFSQAAVVIATDSGPMHLAAATGVKVVGVFGPDTPDRYRPWNPASISVTLALPCSPCNNCWVYREARCTNPDRFACVQTLPAELVLRAAGSAAAATAVR